MGSIDQVTTAAAGSPVPATLDPARPPVPHIDLPPITSGPPLVTPDDHVVHVARRLAFGPTPELLEDIAARGPALWIERQLRPDRIADTDVDVALARYQTLGWSNQQMLLADDVAGKLVLPELRHATLLRAVLSRRQLQETMVDFWTNHLNTHVGKGRVRYFKTTEDREVIRPHALGRFVDLLTASAKSPAMLEYLDNDTSRGANPNENYGRELLELHTVGVDGGYDEADVKGAALVLTGWTWERSTGAFVFRPEWHHDGPARVLDWTTSGQSGPGAIADGEALLSHLARHPATARFLAFKLAQRFVADDPPDEVVQSTADAYLAAGTDIARTLRHLFATTAFGDAGPKLRRPYDAVAAALRATDAQIDPDPTGDAARRLDATLRALGQRLFDEPAPTGYPEVAGPWISTDAMLRRWSLATELLTNRIPGVTVDVAALAGPTPETAGELVDRLATRLLFAPLTAGRREALFTFLGVEAAAPVTDEMTADLPVLAALVLASPDGQDR